MLFDWRLDRPGFAGTVIQEFDAQTMRLVGQRKHFYKGTDWGVCEGPHILQKDGWYYLLCAAGGTGYHHAATVARARTLDGPWENSPYHPLLTAWDAPENPLQKSGHACFLEKDGRWYITHICARPLTQRGNCTLGRETALQEIEWVDGWPRRTPDLWRTERPCVSGTGQAVCPAGPLAAGRSSSFRLYRFANPGRRTVFDPALAGKLGGTFMKTIGVDLGGTNIKAALVDEQGKILKEKSVKTNLPRPAERVCDDIAALCNELAGGQQMAGIGVGCPGTVDGGMVLYSNNLDWKNFAMGDYLTAKTGLSVRIANDANAVALGEALAGCARGAHSAVILTLGTGVGGGVVLEGKLLTGYTGAAAEPGHMVILDTPDAARCTCGRRGCLEAYASATALIRMTKEAMKARPESVMHHMKLSGRTAFDAAEQGDAAAQAMTAQYIHFLAMGAANLINVFFPEVVGLSGGVANQGEALLAPLRAEVEHLVFGHDFAQKKTRIAACTLGYRAGVIGAALLARN